MLKLLKKDASRKNQFVNLRDIDKELDSIVKIVRKNIITNLFTNITNQNIILAQEKENAQLLEESKLNIVKNSEAVKRNSVKSLNIIKQNILVVFILKEYVLSKES